MGSLAIASAIGFAIGFAIAMEIGRSIYNRKMDELRVKVQKLYSYIDLLGDDRG